MGVRRPALHGQPLLGFPPAPMALGPQAALVLHPRPAPVPTRVRRHTPGVLLHLLTPSAPLIRQDEGPRRPHDRQRRRGVAEVRPGVHLRQAHRAVSSLEGQLCYGDARGCPPRRAQKLVDVHAAVARHARPAAAASLVVHGDDDADEHESAASCDDARHRASLVLTLVLALGDTGAAKHAALQTARGGRRQQGLPFAGIVLFRRRMA
mmetsp:Transcript_34611/g.99716  ORF Transcript_34611/g.99716 Transcript_34611/m.99716 type:complete len:208 (-) Transcript_34611:108-731(-)